MLLLFHTLTSSHLSAPALVRADCLYLSWLHVGGGEGWRRGLREGEERGWRGKEGGQEEGRKVAREGGKHRKENEGEEGRGQCWGGGGGKPTDDTLLLPSLHASRAKIRHTAALKNACLLPPKPSNAAARLAFLLHTHTTHYLHAPQPQHPVLPLQHKTLSCCPALTHAAPALSTPLLPGSHPRPPPTQNTQLLPGLHDLTWS